MRKPTITIQNGHRNAPNGKTGTNGEMDLIDKVYYALSPILQEAGLTVYYDDANVKNGNSDYYVCLHFDGSVNPDYNGGFVDDSPDDLVKEKSWKFAQTVADHYFGPMGIRFAPEHHTANSTYYYAFNQTGENTQQFLIELGTLTNAHDKAILSDYAKIAKLLSEGILSYLSQTDENYKAYLAGQTPPPPSTDPHEAEIKDLKDQLQKAKDAYNKLQTDSDKLLAQKDSDCQAEKGRVISLIKDAIKLLNQA